MPEVKLLQNRYCPLKTKEKSFLRITYQIIKLNTAMETTIVSSDELRSDNR